MLDRINSRLAGEEITDIRFNLDMSLGRPENKKHQIKKNKKTSTPDREQTRKFEAMFSSLKDEELKGTINRLWRKFKEIR